MIKSNITGKQLQTWRETHGWPRTWLAQSIGVSHSALWTWEKADFIPQIAAHACAAVENGISIKVATV